MTNTNNPEHKDQEGHFYKGLFFGLLIGIGTVWFINSEGGKDLVKKARNKIDEALKMEPGREDYDFVDETPAEPINKPVKKTSAPRRFFQKKSK